MAAPTPTARVTPAGRKLENGFVCKVTVAVDPDIALWEIGVTPPGIDGGDPIDITTQWSVLRREKAPRTLHDITDASMTAAFDGNTFPLIEAIVNIPTTLTFLFWDGSTEAHYGFLRTFARNEMVEGTMPTATVALTITSWDHVNDVAAGPAVAGVSGT